MSYQTETKSILDNPVTIERAIIYCRTSGNDTKRDSLSDQEIACQEYCEAQNYAVVATLKEDVGGVSGAEFYAPKLYEILNLAKDKGFDVLVVRDIKRFSREAYKSGEIESKLNKCGIRLEFVQDQHMKNSEKFVKQVLYAASEKEKDDTVKRLVDGRRNRVKNKSSVITSGQDPFGYHSKIIPVIDERGLEVSKRIFEIIESEARIVRLIFDLYVNHNMSLKEIAKKLNEDGILTYTALRGADKFKYENTIWYAATVRNVLRNETYAGTWRYGKRVVNYHYELVKGEIKKVRTTRKNSEDYWITLKVPEIVSKELFEVAQAKLDKNKKNAGRKSNYECFLSKRLTCRCGCKMQVQTHHEGKYRYYHCNTRQNMLKRDCDQKNIRAELADAIAWEWFYSILSNKDLIRDKLENHKEERRKAIEPLIERLNYLNDYVGELLDRYNQLMKLWETSDEFGQELILPRKSQLEAEIKKARYTRNELDEEVSDLKIDYTWDEFKGWPDFDADEELAFEEKVKYAKKYNLQATVMTEGEKTYLHLTCDFGEDYRELNNIKYYVIQCTKCPI